MPIQSVRTAGPLATVTPRMPPEATVVVLTVTIGATTPTVTVWLVASSVEPAQNLKV